MKRKKVSKGTNTIKKLQEHVEHIKKTVYEGNGKPSIISQLSNLDNRLESIELNLDNKITHLNKEMELKFTHITEVVSEKFTNISHQISREFDNKKIDSTGQWNFKTAVTTSILAAGTSVFIVLLSEIMKRLAS